MITRILPLLTLVFLAFGAFAQSSDKSYTVERTWAVKVGDIPPVRDLLPRNPTDEQKLADLKAGKPEYVRNFIGRRQESLNKAGTLPRGEDPLVRSTTRDGSISILPIVNVNGINQQQSGTGVPDPTGDVSDQHYLQAVNSTWLQVFDLAGNKVGNAFRANTIWSQIGFASAGDPIVLFDQEVNRWFLTEFPSSNRVLLAVSDTQDPMGSWKAYAFSTPSFPDYPKYGIWPNAYVLTTNEGGGTIKFYTINREQILAGEDMIDVQRFTIPRFSSPSWQTTQPVDWNGDMDVAEGTLPMIMRINDDAYGNSPVDQVEIYEVDVNWNDEDSSVVKEIEIPVAPFDSEFCSESGFGFDCVPQPNGQGIDGIPYIFMNACHYRNFGTHSSIVGNFTVDVTGLDDGGIRWIELRKVGDGPWELYQEGTVGSQEGLNRFMGGIGIDSKGNIGLAYNVSSEVKHPSLRFTGRRASDPLGQMTVLEYEFVSGTGSEDNDRFGDYASMSVDRQDMFWYTGEFVTPNGWATQIVGFRLTRDSIDIGPRGLAGPQDGPDLGMEEITACVINHGLVPQTSFQIGMITPDSLIVIDTVAIDTLFTDSVYCHTFTTLVDLSAFGPHEIVVFTSMELDSNVINDTCIFTVVKQTTWDAKLARVEGNNQVLCDTFTQVALVLQNAGVAELTSANVIWNLNGGQNDTIAWSGSLTMGELEDIFIDVNGLNAGANQLTAYTELPSGNPDQWVQNDTLRFGIFSTPGGQQTTLQLETDLYPNETSWVIIDSSGAVILQGGPYDDEETLYTEVWCLDTSQCYTFVLLDAFGDGIQGDNVEGHFQIINGEGIVVASLNDPDFGFSDTTLFCLQSNCALAADIFIKHESRPGAGNGTINILTSGGMWPLQFSVDGGVNFQTGSFFTGLEPGVYRVVVRDALGCIYFEDVTILPCDLQILATVTPATGAQNADGSIEISVEGNNGPLTYSINGGQFGPSPEFLNLLPDTFAISVKDSVGCTVTVDIAVDYTSSVDEVYVGSIVRVFPNPSSGYFEFEVEGVPNVIQLSFDVLGADGKAVYSGFASNYSGIVKGSFSIRTKPAGEYFLRFRHSGLHRLIPVVKQ